MMIKGQKLSIKFTVSLSKETKWLNNNHKSLELATCKIWMLKENSQFPLISSFIQGLRSSPAASRRAGSESRQALTLGLF